MSPTRQLHHRGKKTPPLRHRPYRPVPPRRKSELQFHRRLSHRSRNRRPIASLNHRWRPQPCLPGLLSLPLTAIVCPTIALLTHPTPQQPHTNWKFHLSPGTELESCVCIYKGDFMGHKSWLGLLLLLFTALATGGIALAAGKPPPAR